MWLYAIGPALAATLVIAAASWHRTTVRLHRKAAVKPPIVTAAKLRADAAGTASPDAAAAASTAPCRSEVHRFDESAHWIRRVAARPPVRDAVARIVQRELQLVVEAQLAKLVNRRDFVSHAAVRTTVKGLIPNIEPTCCDDEVNRQSWVEVRAGCQCTGSVEIDIDLTFRHMTVPVSCTISDLRIAGAVARLHTDGAGAGDVDVIETPEISFQLHTSVGHSGAWISLYDISLVPFAIEWLGGRAARAVIGRVFHGALTKVVECLLPEAVRNAPQKSAAAMPPTPAAAGASPNAASR